MKKQLLLFILLIMPILHSQGQTWQSMSYYQFSNTVPYGQFVIDQFRNDIWMINDNKVAVIKNSGEINIFDYEDLGTLWTGDNLRFTFTTDSLFYMLETIGLLNFNNYLSSEIVLENSISSITSNSDTVYISRAGSLLKYINGVVIDSYYTANNVIAKNSFLYSDNGILGHQVNFSNELLWNDPQYLLANINDKKFQRNTDSIYIGTTKGMMLAYNYDVLDTITPNNTANMPSSNVLEIEFDNKDSLWAVFGDINDDPFAIAKLEGGNWTNLIDISNSPINFSLYKGLEIDTLGNLWVADEVSLHTLLNPNSPLWLQIEETNFESNFMVFPNPSNQSISIRNIFTDSEISLIDLQGRTLIETKNPDNIDISYLKSGNYIVKVTQGTLTQFQQFIKN
jgi:ligand-binding sensor domain-containing protein